MSSAHGIEAGLSYKLFGGAVFEDEDGRPDEVSEEASPEDYDEDGEILPEVEAVICQQGGFCQTAYWLACVESEGKEAAHNSSKDGDGEAFAEVVIGLSSFSFFFGRNFALFRHASSSIDGDADDAYQNTQQDNLAGGCVKDGMNLVVIDRGDDRPEGGAKAKGDGVSESDAEIADGEAEGEAAGSPENSPEDGVIDAAGILRIGGVEDSEDVGDEEPGEDDRRHNPRGEALNKPVDLPRPTLDAAEGDEVSGRGEASYPVKDDA